MTFANYTWLELATLKASNRKIKIRHICHLATMFNRIIRQRPIVAVVYHQHCPGIVQTQLQYCFVLYRLCILAYSYSLIDTQLIKKRKQA